MKKLTYKTFVLLLLLSLAVSAFAYGCIWIFFPYVNRNTSTNMNTNYAKHELETKTEQLVAQLRTVKRADSETLFWDFGRETNADLLLLDAAGQSVSFFTFRNIEAKIFQGTRHPFKFIDSEDEYILIVRYNPARLDELVRAILSSIPYVAAVTMILSFLSAWIFSYYTTHPIIRINKIASKMAELDFSWYCPDIRKDEIGMLSKSINKLSDKLHEALDELSLRNAALEDEIRLEKERERRRMLFFSGISHELKTPIAIVIGQLEGMQAGIGVYKDREKYLARSEEILQSLNQFIKEVLFVSHIDMTEQNMSKMNQLNISNLTDALLEEYSGYAEFYSVSITREVEDGLFTYGDSALFEKAIGNIISNAVTHVPENGHVMVRLRGVNDRIELTVSNTPAHIADEHLEHLFEAFYRVNESNEHGSGLGLYITRMIFETYQVEHRIENTSDGVKFTAIFIS